METIAIRPGLPEDAPQAARLMREAGDMLMDFLAGFRGRGATETVLADLWNVPGTRFSREQARVALVNGRPSGILIGYPQERMPALDRATGRALFSIQGWSFILRALRHPFLSWRMSSLPEAEPGDWYVCVLAVDVEFRGRGLGAALLGDAEDGARNAGAKRISLMVSGKNGPARALYERFGFRERDRFSVAGRVSLRMSKSLVHAEQPSIP